MHKPESISLKSNIKHPFCSGRRWACLFYGASRRNISWSSTAEFYNEQFTRFYTEKLQTK